MAYSSGFSPHPRISYANASPTGASSEAEYVELCLSRQCDAQKVMAALNEVLPPGFEILAAADAVRASLGDLLEVSQWLIDLPSADEVALTSAAAALLATPELNVERTTKKGVRTFDVRGAVMDVHAENRQLHLTLRHLEPLVRPDDVVEALRRVQPGLAVDPVLLTRLDQGPWTDGHIGDPLA